MKGRWTAVLSNRPTPAPDPDERGRRRRSPGPVRRKPVAPAPTPAFDEGGETPARTSPPAERKERREDEAAGSRFER